MESWRENFLISTDKKRLQLKVIVNYLQNESYWAKYRTE